MVIYKRETCRTFAGTAEAEGLGETESGIVVEHFNRVQRSWSLWAVWLSVIAIVLFLMVLAAEGQA